MLQQNTADFKVNLENLELFWYWVKERNSIYKKKTAEEPKPWTDDLILQNYKFDNVFRRLDRTSAWYIDNIVTRHWNDDKELLLFNTFVFRAFNWVPTYQYLVIRHGKNGWLENWDEWKTQQTLRDYHAFFGNQLTSGAYMIRGYLGQKKWESIPNTLGYLWNEQKNWLTKTAQEGNSIQNIVEEILTAELWGWGPFTAYQIALDLTYGPIMPEPTDINDWCVFGPGAKRGIEHIFPGITSKGYLPMAKNLQNFQSDWLNGEVPELNLQDVEFCLCEFSKYMRLKNGGKGVSKYNGI